MIISEMFKFFLNTVIIYFIISLRVLASENFEQWVKNFQLKAIDRGISEKVVVEIMSNAKFLPKVIEYDRYQPEFVKILLHT